MGDVARVRGRIRVVSVVASSSLDDGDSGRGLEAVREIRASSVERTVGWGEGEGGSCTDGESVHWLRCVQFGRRMGIDPTTTTPAAAAAADAMGQGQRSVRPRRCESTSRGDMRGIGNDGYKDSTPSVDEILRLESYNRARSDLREPVRNGPDVLHLLGPKFAPCASPSSLAEYDHDDYSSSSVAAPGGSCCCPAPYKSALLYCHCRATSAPLDPRLRFRDAVLEELLRMEEAEIEEGQAAVATEEGESPSGVAAGARGESTTPTPLPPPTPALTPLRFLYKTLMRNASLSAVASSVLSEGGGGKAANSPNVRRLFLSTFRCLRSDGVVYLEDEERDVYLLVSVRRVLEPHAMALTGIMRGGSRGKGEGERGVESSSSSSYSLSSSLEQSTLRNNPPAFMRRVPRGRMTAVVRLLSRGGADSTATLEGRVQSSGCGSARLDTMARSIS